MRPQTVTADVRVATRPAETSSNASAGSDLNSGPGAGPLSRHDAVLDAEARIRTLTAREREVCRLVAEGMTNKQVGDHLFVSAITIRHHLSSVFRKLSLQSRFELIVLSYRYQFLVQHDVSRPARSGVR